MSEALPQRVVVIGASGAGKTRLAERLARALDAPFVEMDALYWLPEWVARAPEEFVGRLAQATAGERWVAAGNYFSSGAGQTVWARADCLVWIDLPLRTTLPRLLVRSWRRWRHHELLWGRNVERFWPQFRLWDTKASLWAYAIRTHRSRRRRYLEVLRDPRWAHMRIVHLTSPRDVEAFARGIEARAGSREG